MFTLVEAHAFPVEIEPEDPKIREKILELEAMMMTLPQELKYDFPTFHHFSEGIYAREILIPKGALLVGKIHKFANLNIVSQGDITVLTENGLVRLQAPRTFVSPPGVKRVGYAHEDTVWTTIHGVHSTDLDEIEGMVIAHDFDEVQHSVMMIEIPALGGD